MSKLTEKAIKASFVKLLNEKPLSKITVKDIVEDCGINRNSFYYHYSDIPTLIEEIVMECFDALIKKYHTLSSLSDGFNAAFEFSLENKNLMRHIYNSVSRDILERYLMQYCEQLITLYLDTAFGKDCVKNSDRTLIIRFLKCELFGAYIDWINSGMPKEVIGEVNRMFELCKGFPEEIIRRCNE